KQHNFEVIVGKSMLSFEEGEEERVPSLKRFGFVQTLDTQSKRRLYEVLQSQGLQMNQEITFLSDSDDTLRQLQLELSPKATHILDWFHLITGCKFSREHTLLSLALVEVQNKGRGWCRQKNVR